MIDGAILLEGEGLDRLLGPLGQSLQLSRHITLVLGMPSLESFSIAQATSFLPLDVVLSQEHCMIAPSPFQIKKKIGFRLLLTIFKRDDDGETMGAKM